MAVHRQHGTKNFNKKWAITQGDFNLIMECESHVEEILEQLDDAVIKGLIECGMVAEGYAKKACAVKTGRLRNSITFTVDENELSMTVGTPVEYASYVEFGTGQYATNGGGRPTPWVYQDAKGNWHMTHGTKAKPFIKPAVADHAKTYHRILGNNLKFE